MPDKMDLDYLKLLYCEFEKYEAMTMSVEGAQPKKTPQIPVTKQFNLTLIKTSTFVQNLTYESQV